MVRKYFQSTASERNGAVILLGIIACFGLYYLISYNYRTEIQEINQVLLIEQKKNDTIYKKDNLKHFFKFDPNELDVAGWIDLGFSSKQAGSIVKYRYSLGRFKHSEELLNCYVIDSIKYFELFPYIEMSKKKDIDVNALKIDIQAMCYVVFLVSAKDPIYDRFDEFQTMYYSRNNNQYQYYSELSDDSVALGMHVNKAIKSGFSTARIIQINPQKLWNISTEKILIDINIADTLLLKSLSGIGPVLSKRIVEYRGKLGGFLNKEQLKEIYGFRIETYDKIKNKIEVLDSTIIRININTVSIEAFKNHPYINWNLANSIVNYREQHGQYTSIEKIKSIHLVVDEIYRKIAPYLRID